MASLLQKGQWLPKPSGGKWTQSQIAGGNF